MKFLPFLRRLVDADASTMYECRHCGETVDSETDSCPNCGTDDIAEYRF